MVNPRELPIYELESALAGACRGGGARLVIQAPTGSGKSTQIPQILLDSGLVKPDQQIILLQPRRLAARMLAARVADERNVPLGGEIGYQVRFEDRTSAATRIRFITEGILLRLMLSDPALARAGVLIFDEFHERHLFTDVTLAMALRLQATARPDLTLIVMSATLDSAAVEKYLAPCRVLRSEGRMFPVRMEYLPKPVDPAKTAVWELAADVAERLLRDEPEGDVLVFMPGAYEINKTIQALKARPRASHCALLPLHGELSSHDQDAAVAPAGRRKIIVSTNVAETSLTIAGVRLVVDSGQARVARFDPYRGIDTLWIERISRASADQRAGRAGRTAPGVCARLWSEREHGGLANAETPEIRRVDLAETLLMLKAAGFDKAASFPWFEPPEPKSVERAERTLEDLGAADESGRITSIGRRMLAFPLHPRYARMLLAAEALECVATAALLAALTQERNLLAKRADEITLERRERELGEERESDFFLLVRAWQTAAACGYDVGRCRAVGIHAGAARQVGRLFDQFCRIAGAQGLPLEETPVSDDRIRRCLLAGFADQVARRLDGGTLRCALVHGRRGVLARDSAVRRSAFLVAAEVTEVERGGSRGMDVLISLATGIEPAWLTELFPGAVKESTQVILDDATRRVVAERTTKYHDLVLEAKRGGTPPEDDAARLLAAEVTSGRVALKDWNEAVEQWIFRVNGLRQWCPDFGLPEMTADDRAHMVEQICHGAFGIKEIKDRPVLPVVKSWLSHAQQALVEKHAPERLELPNGKKAKVVYAESGPPTVAARIQDLYGVEGSLRIALGRQPLVIQVLAPNFRPVQVTSDLTVFWKQDYPRLKKELQRKYPKHEWR